MSIVKNFLKDESGATAVEYALIAAGIGVVVAAAAATLGDSVENTFAEISCTVEGNVWTAGAPGVPGNCAPRP